MLNRRDFFLASTAGIALSGTAFARPAGGADAALDQALEAFYQAALDESPMLATSLGLDTGPRAAAKARLDDASLAAVARHKKLVSDELARLKNIDRRQLGPAAAINYDAALYDLAGTDAADRRFAYGGTGAGAPYVLSQINGAYTYVPDFLDSQHIVATAADAEAYLARLDAFAQQMDDEVEHVRHDAGLGVIPPDFAIDGALAQMKVLRQPAASSTLVASLVTRTAARNIAGDWQARAAKIYEGRVVPAIDRQMALLAGLRPKAVHDAGVWRLPDGDAYYAASLRGATTTDLSPDEVHKMGLDVTKELTARADTLFGKIGLTKGSVSERYQALFKDPKFLYPNNDAGKAKEDRKSVV